MHCLRSESPGKQKGIARPGTESREHRETAPRRRRPQTRLSRSTECVFLPQEPGVATRQYPRNWPVPRTRDPSAKRGYQSRNYFVVSRPVLSGHSIPIIVRRQPIPEPRRDSTQPYRHLIGSPPSHRPALPTAPRCPDARGKTALTAPSSPPWRLSLLPSPLAPKCE